MRFQEIKFRIFYEYLKAVQLNHGVTVYGERFSWLGTNIRCGNHTRDNFVVITPIMRALAEGVINGVVSSSSSSFDNYMEVKKDKESTFIQLSRSKANLFGFIGCNYHLDQNLEKALGRETFINLVDVTGMLEVFVGKDEFTHAFYDPEEKTLYFQAYRDNKRASDLTGQDFTEFFVFKILTFCTLIFSDAIKEQDSDEQLFQETFELFNNLPDTQPLSFDIYKSVTDKYLTNLTEEDVNKAIKKLTQDYNDIQLEKLNHKERMYNEKLTELINQIQLTQENLKQAQISRFFYAEKETPIGAILAAAQKIKGIKDIWIAEIEGEPYVHFDIIVPLSIDEEFVKETYLYEKYKFFKGIADRKFTINMKQTFAFNMSFSGKFQVIKAGGMGKSYQDGIPTYSNPHLEYFNCIGSFSDAIIRSLQNENWLAFLSYLVNSVRQINLADSFVTNRFRDNYLASSYFEVYNNETKLPEKFKL